MGCVFKNAVLTRESACEEVIKLTENNVENILQGHIENLLKYLTRKMNNNGIIAVPGYAKFFKDEMDECENDQN